MSVHSIVSTDQVRLQSSSGPDEGQVARAKVLTEDLLEVVHTEHGKAQGALAQQQMELHQAQMQYAQYSVMSVRPYTLSV